MTEPLGRDLAGNPPGGGPPPGFGGQPPGGYGPPGAPPGGYGGPPGGPPAGAPPGGYGPPGAPPGGYGGGPPGGGYGGPPGAPPGGYGPPPGGPPPGGFGAPPSGPHGGYGPPGYGSPGFGAPVGAPPRKSGPSAGLLVGIGCGALLLLSVIIAAVVFFMRSGDAEVASSDEETSPSAEASAVVPAPAPAGEGSLELQDVRLFSARGTGSVVYVVGELVNTGTAPVNAPRAKVTVLDASQTALDSTVCGAFVVRDLQPKEKVPCFSVMSKAAGFKTFKVEPEFNKTALAHRAADLKISDVESTSPRGAFGAHKVTGTITNRSAFAAKSVWVVVGLYGKDGKIVGAGKTLVAGHDLAPGASGRFNVSIYNVAEQPTRSLTKVFGYDK